MNLGPRTKAVLTHLAGFARAVLMALALAVFMLSGTLLFSAEPVRFGPVQFIYFFFCILNAALVWTCHTWLTPRLERLCPGRLAPRLVIGLSGMFAGVNFITIGVYLHLFVWIMGRQVYPHGLFDVAYRAALVCVFVYGWLIMQRFLREEDARGLQIQLDTEALATDVDRSELAMLEAQIEPHFLFNTLAHVKRLYRVQADSADEVLQTLIVYLERALPALRRKDWNVGDELELIGLYLSLLELRFGGRLRYTLEADDSARQFRIPALTVATLVENAAKHGLGPKAGQGSITVSARRMDAGMQLSVLDDGVGLLGASGSGLGLATVRARLLAMFGARATLVVEPAPGSGVHAAIRVADGVAHAA